MVTPHRGVAGPMPAQPRCRGPVRGPGQGPGRSGGALARSRDEPLERAIVEVLVTAGAGRRQTHVAPDDHRSADRHVLMARLALHVGVLPLEKELRERWSVDKGWRRLECLGVVAGGALQRLELPGMHVDVTAGAAHVDGPIAGGRRTVDPFGLVALGALRDRVLPGEREAAVVVVIEGQVEEGALLVAPGAGQRFG